MLVDFSEACMTHEVFVAAQIVRRGRGYPQYANCQHYNGNEIGPRTLLKTVNIPFSLWLIKPCPGGTRDLDEINYNKELSTARVKVECA